MMINRLSIISRFFPKNRILVRMGEGTPIVELFSPCAAYDLSASQVKDIAESYLRHFAVEGKDMSDIQIISWSEEDDKKWKKK